MFPSCVTHRKLWDISVCLYFYIFFQGCTICSGIECQVWVIWKHGDASWCISPLLEVYFWLSVSSSWSIFQYYLCRQCGEYPILFLFRQSTARTIKLLYGFLTLLIILYDRLCVYQNNFAIYIKFIGNTLPMINSVALESLAEFRPSCFPSFNRSKKLSNGQANACHSLDMEIRNIPLFEPERKKNKDSTCIMQMKLTQHRRNWKQV